MHRKLTNAGQLNRFSSEYDSAYGELFGPDQRTQTNTTPRLNLFSRINTELNNNVRGGGEPMSGRVMGGAQPAMPLSSRQLNGIKVGAMEINNSSVDQQQQDDYDQEDS